MTLRLLAVDDSLTIRKLVELSFRSMPCVLDFASSGREALEKLAAKPPDVVLLDVLLPDLKAAEVCSALARSKTFPNTPIILMTGKDASVLEQFKDFPFVVDHLGKPFTADALITKVNQVVERSGGAAPHPTRHSLFDFAQQEQAAKALYEKLRPHLGLLPEWFEQLGEAAPAPFFARKLLTPEVISELLEALTPSFRAAMGNALPGPLDPEAAPANLEGTLAGVSFSEVLRSLMLSGRTGALTLQRGRQRALVYLRKGAVTLVTSTEMSSYVRGASPVTGGDLTTVPADALARAESEQRSSGKPVFVELSESGELPVPDLQGTLFEQGRRLLGELLDVAVGHYAWRDLPLLPRYVEACGRTLSGAQITLEHARRRRATPERPLGTVYERVPGFSRRFRQLQLSESERSALSRVDGRRTLAQLLAGSGQDASDLRLNLSRLAEVELLRERSASAESGNKVLIFDPDWEGVQQPLSDFLMLRRIAHTLIPLRDETQGISVVRREHPSLVIYNATDTMASSLELARSVLLSNELAEVSLAAVLDYPSTVQTEALTAAGFDVVLTKPIHFSDIARLLM